MEITKLLPTLLRTFNFSYDARRHRKLQPRDSDGRQGDPAIPWTVSSFWFLEVKVREIVRQSDCCSSMLMASLGF
jgi:hypothetical protein